MKLRNIPSKIFGLGLASFLFFNGYSAISMYLNNKPPLPNYDYLFPLTQIATVIASLITIFFLLGYVFEPNSLTNEISEISKIDFENNIHGLFYVLLCGVFWLVFGLQIASGIQAFEINFILGETVDFSGINEASIFLSQLILFIPFVFIPISYIAIVSSKDPWKALELEKDRLLENIGFGVLTGVFILIVVGIVNFGLAEIFNLQQENLAVNQIAQLGPFFAVFISLTAGITEEIFFRGFLQNKIGLLGASFLFAITHASYGILIQITGPFLFGLIIGWVYKKRKNLLAPITAHISMNLITLLISIYFPLT